MGKVEKFVVLAKKVNKSEIRDLLVVCGNFDIPQKVIYTTAAIYLRHRSIHEHLRPITLCTASIGLASKIFEQPRKYKDILYLTCSYFGANPDDSKLLNEALNLECQICIENVFDVELYDPYLYLDNYSQELGIPEVVVKRAIVFLNDTVYQPYSIVFQIKKIVKACIALSLMFEEEQETKVCGGGDDDVEFIVKQIIDFYCQYY